MSKRLAGAMKKLFHISMILAFISALSVAQAAIATTKYDFSGSDEYQLVTCQSPSELDCVESFGFVDSSNRYIDADLVRTVQGNSFTDNLGNTIHPASTEWQAPVDGKVVSATLTSHLQSPNWRIWKNPDDSFHYGAHLENDIETALPLKTTVRFLVRTSFLSPMNIQMEDEDTDFAQIKISGGNKWMFQGRGTPLSNYFQNPNGDWSKPADAESIWFHFSISHADPDLSKGYWPGVCASEGYTVQAGNWSGGGDPYWDESTKSLNFAIQAPHTDSKGIPVIGFFKLWTTDAFMNCKWPGNSLSNSPNITVNVLDENGVTQVAETQILHSGGKLYISATGFHYSSPTIRIEAALAAAEPSSSAEVSSKQTTKTITCKKGKKVKRVTGVSPHCPAGFIRQK
jgi:hypothetical protein